MGCISSKKDRKDEDAEATFDAPIDGADGEADASEGQTEDSAAGLDDSVGDELEGLPTGGEDDEEVVDENFGSTANDDDSEKPALFARPSLRKTEQSDVLAKQVEEEEARAKELDAERASAFFASQAADEPEGGAHDDDDDEAGFAGFEEEARADELARAEERLREAKEKALKRSEEYDKLVVRNASVKPKLIEKENTTFGFIAEDEVSDIRRAFVEAEKAERERRQKEEEVLSKPKKRWTPPPKKELPPSKASLGIPDDLDDSDYSDDDTPAVKPQDLVNAADGAASEPAAADGADGDNNDDNDGANGTDAGAAGPGKAAAAAADAGGPPSTVPEWVHWRLDKDAAEVALGADCGLEDQGRYLVRTLAEREEPGDYILSVVFRGQCTHHRLVLPVEGRAELNNAAMPEDIDTLDKSIGFLQEERDEPLWPLALTTRVPRPSASAAKTKAEEEFATLDTFAGEVESSDEEEEPAKPAFTSLFGGADGNGAEEQPEANGDGNEGGGDAAADADGDADGDAAGDGDSNGEQAEETAETDGAETKPADEEAPEAGDAADEAASADEQAESGGDGDAADAAEADAPTDTAASADGNNENEADTGDDEANGDAFDDGIGLDGNPKWLFPELSRERRNELLAADEGLSKQGHFFVSAKPGGEEGRDFIISVAFNKKVTHHKLVVGDDGCQLNDGALPEDVTTLVQAVSHLREKRRKWPVALTTHVVNTGGD